MPSYASTLISADQRLDLIGAAVEVASRFGAPPGSGAVARKLAEAPRLLLAAPAFMLAEGEPASPDYRARRALLDRPAALQRSARLFGRRGKTVNLRVTVG